jgi:DNA-binding transcriptional MerR regulator
MGKAAQAAPGNGRHGGPERAFKIGRLAELADCQPVTIRYYEREGLLDKPTRGDNGYRVYGRADLERLRFIRHCRDHGIPLSDVKELLKLRKEPELCCQPVDAMLDSIIDKLEDQIRSIRRLRRNLVTLKSRCHGGTTIGECAIMKTLSNRDSCSCDEAEPQP